MILYTNGHACDACMNEAGFCLIFWIFLKIFKFLQNHLPVSKYLLSCILQAHNNE
jgi:hypothetical protein